MISDTSAEGEKVLNIYNSYISSPIPTVRNLVDGKDKQTIEQNISGDRAIRGEPFGFPDSRDNSQWLAETHNGECIILSLESVRQLTEDLRSLPSGYSVKDLELLVKAKTNNPSPEILEAYKKATTLFTPEEKIKIAMDAIKNIQSLDNVKANEIAENFLQSETHHIFFLTSDDYLIFQAAMYPNKPQADMLSSGGEIIKVRSGRFPGGNGKPATTEYTIPADNTTVIIIRENRPTDRSRVVDTARSLKPGEIPPRLKGQILLEDTRILTHELFHAMGIGDHLGPLAEMANEFYAIKAQNLGEEARDEPRDSVNMGYEIGTALFATLYSALNEVGKVSYEDLDNAFMTGNYESMQKTLAGLNKMLGKDDAERLIKYRFNNDREAFIWLKNKLSNTTT